MSKPLTDRQKSILDFIVEFHSREDRLPSTRELAKQFGWASQTHAIDVFDILVKKGALEHRSSLVGGRNWWRFPRKASETQTPEPIHS